MRELVLKLWRGEPSYVVGVLEAACMVFILFGPFDLSEVEMASAFGLVRFVGATLTRQNVYAPETIDKVLPRIGKTIFDEAMGGAGKKVGK